MVPVHGSVGKISCYYTILNSLKSTDVNVKISNYALTMDGNKKSKQT